MRFKGKYTRYRNIPFIFKGTYVDAFKYFILYFILVPFTIGIIVPYIHFKQKKYIIDNYKYGSLPIIYNGNASTFYIALFASMFVSAFFAFAIFMIGFFIANMIGLDIISKFFENINTTADIFIFGSVLILYFLFIIAMTFGALFYKVFILNNVVSQIYCGNSKLICSLDYLKIFGIVISNAFAVIVTLGLAYPWAKIRYNRYFYSCISLDCRDNLEEITNIDEKQIASFAEELGGFLELDIGF